MKKDERTPKKRTPREATPRELEAFADLKSAEADALDEFVRTMKEEVIPKIVSVVEKRRLLAARSRHWQLKC